MTDGKPQDIGPVSTKESVEVTGGPGGASRLSSTRDLRARTAASLRPSTLLSRPRVALVRLSARVHPALAVVAVLTVLASGLLPAVYMVASGRLVGAVAPAVAGGFGSPAGDALVRALVVVGVLYAVQVALVPVLNLGTSALTRRVDRAVSERIMRAILGPPGIGHLEDPVMQDEVAKASGIVGGSTPGVALSGLVQLWAMRLGGVGAFIILLNFRWWVAVGLLVAVLFERRFWARRFDDLTKAFFDTGQVHRRSGWYRDASLLPGPSKEVRTFGLSHWFRQRQHESWEEAMAPVWERMWGRPLVLAWHALWPIVPHGLAFAVLGRAALRGDVGVEQVVVFAQAILNIQSIGGTGDFDHQISTGVAALPVALDLEQRLRDPQFALGGDRPADGLPARSITFEKVGFRYHGRDDDVYAELDLEIPAGQSLAIVGANGAGKTTFVKLLARLYEPTSGRITVDGVDLAEIDPKQWQRRIAAIFQDFHRYELPARDNVTFGAPAIAGDDEALARAADLAGATAIVDELDKGWETPLSRQLTGGTDLSGGQWQRLALARALFAVEGGARVLVLDEPSANLDVRAEAELYDRFLDVTAGLTTVVISHRFSTVRRADRIAVLVDGKVAELGSHDELVALGGVYAEMFMLQASRYEDEAMTLG